MHDRVVDFAHRLRHVLMELDEIGPLHIERVFHLSVKPDPELVFIAPKR